MYSSAKKPVFFWNRFIQFQAVLIATGVAFIVYVLLVVARQGPGNSLLSSENSLALQRNEEQYLADIARMMYEQNHLEFRLLTEELNKIKQELKTSMDSVEDKIDKLVAEKEAATTPEPKTHLKPNFAQIYLGAKIHSHSASNDPDVYQFFNIPLMNYKRDPDIVLQGNEELTPGLCWRFEGAHGEITVKLLEPVNITQLTYRHLAPYILSDDAPKMIEVSAGYQHDSLFFVGQMMFVDQEADVAMLQLEKPVIGRFVRFSVVSNHGGQFTCLYRLGIHGERLTSE
ncbi:unnamed protein product [Bursaphelenchus okinawaensis]|uniref:SUN domain-containing protein n=1 Tax=Bursaphelenchus okinawaensis TaxID=465554 RepID=A0A811L3C4_9BILA|nr:unnamed protein product [Bursaphelenchus okinawaensis]CAG9116781.1 unnamed protein product [Bursaphelenchus okinawaensis]